MNLNKIMRKVFLWMVGGLLFTFGTAFYVSTNEKMIYKILSTNLYYILIVVELILVIVLSARISKMNTQTAKILFILYSFVTGLTFSSIFVAFNLSSIIYIFLITAIVYALLGLIGYTTKVDLSKIGVYLFIGLIGVVICSIINIFVVNSLFEIIISSVSLIVFLGFTAYDVQSIKRLSYEYDDNDSVAVIGALKLYLDFINIFLDLITLFGKSKED